MSGTDTSEPAPKPRRRWFKPPGKMHTDTTAWVKELRVKTPTLLQVGRAPPKCVLSFGGAGFLCTYSLGVACFLQREKAAMLAESYLMGAGTGVFPAMALAAGPQAVDIEKIRDRVIENRFRVWHEPSRLKALRKQAEELVPENVAQLISGRLCIAVGLSMYDSGYTKLTPDQQLYGAHIPTFDNKADVLDLIVGSTAPNLYYPDKFRGQPIIRGTFRCLSTQADPYVRHVYIHGLAGTNRTAAYKRHRVLIGRHGCLANTHGFGLRQLQLATCPLGPGSADALRKAFDHGYNDARRYERWEEDPYHFAKPDRSPGEDMDWREIRSAIFGRKTSSL